MGLHGKITCGHVTIAASIAEASGDAALQLRGAAGGGRPLRRGGHADAELSVLGARACRQAGGAGGELREGGRGDGHRPAAWPFSAK